MLSRTHGQTASPTTAGKEMANVTDAGIRGTTLIAKSADLPWFSCKTLMATAAVKVQDFHSMCVIATQKINCRLCLVKKFRKEGIEKILMEQTQKAS